MVPRFHVLYQSILQGPVAQHSATLFLSLQREHRAGRLEAAGPDKQVCRRLTVYFCLRLSQPLSLEDRTEGPPVVTKVEWG